MLINNLIKKNIDLTPYSTWRIGGRAEFFAIVKNEPELLEVVNWAKAKKLPLHPLGGGSNVLIVKKNIKGLVLKISGEQYAIKENQISCWAGTNLTKLSLVAARAGLSGLEWACGIPGSVGGATRGNAGAYGVDISGNLISAQVYDLDAGKKIKLDKPACGFSYRDSIFKSNKNFLIVKVSLKVKPGKPLEIKNIMAENLKRRLEIQPRRPSAGSVFKNLLYKNIVKQNKRLAEDLAAQGRVRGGKIAAGYLIDQLGLKGKSKGGAKVSEKHANFIINTGKASAKDVVYLINLIKKKVKLKYRINLEEEIQYFGT